jgi:uncharacterized RDD family membrane protein YckC
VSYEMVDPTTAVPITGEAVALELRLARLPSRAVALAIDVLIQLVAVTVLEVAVLWKLPDGDGALGAALSLSILVLVIVGYPTITETLTHGRTLGKLALGLRVVRTDGGPVRFRHCFVRALFLVVELWLTYGLVGLLSCLFNAQGRCLGDLFAGTLVVNERVSGAAAIPPYVPVPQGWEPWAAHLDLTRLPEPLAAQGRQLLARWNTLAPQTRDGLVYRLAGEVASFVTPAPPSGLDPGLYLTVVLGERSRRAYLSVPRPSNSPQPPVADPGAAQWQQPAGAVGRPPESPFTFPS